MLALCDRGVARFCWGGERSRLTRAFVGLGVVIAMSACTHAIVREDGNLGRTAQVPPARAQFSVAGRLSARHDKDGLAASFRWRHGVDHDEMDLASPLGQTVAQLSGVPGNVQLLASDGQTITASDWTALTARGLGWPLPIDGLAFWIQGVPREGVSSSIERDAAGLPSVLRQDGWTVVYQAFQPVADAAGVRPVRMTLSYPDVELRLVIDVWE